MAFGGWGLCEGKGFILIGPGGMAGAYMQGERVKCPWGELGLCEQKVLNGPGGRGAYVKGMG